MYASVLGFLYFTSLTILDHVLLMQFHIAKPRAFLCSIYMHHFNLGVNFPCLLDGYFLDVTSQTSTTNWTQQVLEHARLALIIMHLDKNIVKGATQVSGHFSKLHFHMFEKSQMKHNSLDCYYYFWNIFH